ncbi:MAG TPA: hypothetical protein PK867_05360 [Pirellulales bacterium]|nr:hypothetical protein [Pirellulales bacterium]
MGIDIVIVARNEQGHIGVGLRPVGHSHRALDANQGAIAKQAGQHAGEPAHAGRMEMPDWEHAGDFSFDQFKAIVLAQDAGLDHLAVFGNAEKSA